jgi:8-oxo-dGTP pyrophosphatase MutT (NUDIX family)
LRAAPANPPDDLRARIEARLRGTRPGGDPLAALLRETPADKHEILRRAVPPSLVDAAVLVPIVERPQGLTVLLTQRASHLKHHAGQISFPGGRVEPGDSGPWDAALREAEEEVGLSREFVTPAGYLPDHMVISGFRITPAVGFVRPGFDLRLDRTEVEDAFEVPLQFILDPSHHVPRNRHYQGVTVVTYDIPWQGRQIWGATANMLVTLCHALWED